MNRERVRVENTFLRSKGLSFDDAYSLMNGLIEASPLPWKRLYRVLVLATIFPFTVGQ